jgi:ribonuclease HI
MRKIIAYTDGSAVVKGKSKGNGGFGTYFPDLYGEKKAFSAGFKETKTGRMELTALYYAITAIKKTKSTRLVVYSDSEYVVKSFTEGRLKRWIHAGWKNTAGEVKNKDIWYKIVEALSDRKDLVLTMKHIRSHQVDKEKNKDIKKELMKDPNIIGNMMADRLANYKRHSLLLDSDKI